MNKRPLQQISVETSLEAEEAVVELLARLFALPTAVWTNEETRLSDVSVFIQKRGIWNSKRRAELQAGLKQIQASGLNPGAGTISVRRLARKDWSESWKRHFKPISVGSRLLVKPSWIKRKPRKGQAVVVLDPGLSFGTGNHPTTSFCLRELVECRATEAKQSFWDVGTGSGILAIAAAKLGYCPVVAIDFDPESVRVAGENTRKNGVANLIRLRRQDITKLPESASRKYHVICANLISNLLLAERERIVNRLRPGECWCWPEFSRRSLLPCAALTKKPG